MRSNAGFWSRLRTRAAASNSFAGLDSSRYRFSVTNRGPELLCLSLWSRDSRYDATTVTADIYDFIDRGNRYRTTPVRAQRGRIVERIEIAAANLIAGRVRVDTAHAEGEPLSSVIPAAIS
jgi:hypothetical protein